MPQEHLEASVVRLLDPGASSLPFGGFGFPATACGAWRSLLTLATMLVSRRDFSRWTSFSFGSMFCQASDPPKACNRTWSHSNRRRISSAGTAHARRMSLSRCGSRHASAAANFVFSGMCFLLRFATRFLPC